MGYLGHRSVTNVFKLTVNERVSSTNQQKFRDFLIRSRNGDNTPEDWVFRYSRNVSKFNMSSINTAPVRPVYTNSVEVENNYSVLMSLRKSVFTIKAFHHSPKAAKLGADESGGLQLVVQLSVGNRIMLLLIF